jgi:hypothetical protein
MNRNFTLDDKLQAVEQLIVDLRWSRSDPLVPEFKTYWVMKAIADDIRGQQLAVKIDTLVDLQKTIDSVHRSKTEFGYDIGKLQTLAERLIGHWSTVRMALENFAAAEVE